MATRIFITGGGTGGHVYPGLSVAEALHALDPHLDIHYVGRTEGIEARLVQPTGLPFHGIKASGLRGMGWVSRLKFLLNFLLGFGQSFFLMLIKRPTMVLGCGGYVSAPVLAAARSLGIRCCLQEQNAMPGSTNRLTGRWACRVYLGFQGAAKFFPAGSPVVTGNPVRASFAHSAAKRNSRKETVLASPKSHILVFGGSLGARTLNQAAMSAADLWSSNNNLEFVIQTGPGMFQEVSDRYIASDNVQVLPYIEDMPAALLKADLVVCRSGASTLAELQVFGKPSILVPFPHASDDHQLSNARDMEAAGAAMVLEDHLCDGKTLAEAVKLHLANVIKLEKMGAAAASLARPHAAQNIALDILYYCGNPAGRKIVADSDSPGGDYPEGPKSVS